MGSFSEILIRIFIGFVAALGYGFAFLKIYELFRRGVHQNNRAKIWWAFSSAIFLLILIVYLFSQ
ncbi:MAG: hypothetical protein A3E80_05940 [Chlamydiae bacterium RIFCSPHIGHO2_12_FULL_49_9]|nr:MAG: hypothetical protein A3E80_05940 [Chlamydiae bacterium RIFCSPHIGHO2_12_FULL_49_9]